MKAVIAQYKDLERWDVKSFLYVLQSNFPIEELGLHIYEHSEKENIFEQEEKEFPILGVTNKVGVYLNENKKGAEINQPYKKVKAGELTYNPYRVNVGSIGIVQDEFDGFYISPAYVVFGTKETLLNEYLYLVLSSPWFNPFLRSATSGSVRQNLTYDLLRKLKVPIPNIKTQQKIVADFYKSNTQVKQIQTEANQKVKEIDSFLMKELGVEKTEHKKRNGSFVVKYKDLERWGVEFNANKTIIDSKKFNLVKYEELFEVLKNGVDSRTYKDNGDFVYIRVSDIKNNEIVYKTAMKVDKLDKRGLLKEGMMLITRKGTVGQSAIFDKDLPNIGVSSEIFMIILDKEKVLPKYFSSINLSSFVQSQYDERSAGAIMKSISQPNLKAIKIPLPPLKKQSEIVAKIEKIQSEIQKLQFKSADILESAKNELQMAIIGT